jgi:Excinuclease ABC subunit C
VLGSTRPRHIEGFDVSHAQGRAVVGSNVWFVDGQADTAGYRRKRLSPGNDDVGHIAELLTWRARRAARDDRPDPDLLLIDGGPTQLAAAVEAVKAVGWAVPAVSLAKQEEQVFTPDGPLQLADDDPALHLLQRVRDEAHRFAVQYHQTLRDDVQTVLEGVPGVGPTTRQALLRRFGSVENIRQASRADLEDVPGVGPQTAQTLRERL